MTDSALETADQSLHTDYKGRSRFPTRRWDNKSITRAGARNRLTRAQAGGDTHNRTLTMWSDPAFHKMDLYIYQCFNWVHQMALKIQIVYLEILTPIKLSHNFQDHQQTEVSADRSRAALMVTQLLTPDRRHQATHKLPTRTHL